MFSIKLMPMPMPLGTTTLPPELPWPHLNRQSRTLSLVTRCQSSGGHAELQIGSPIIIVEAPVALKTAAYMPSLRINTGQIKTGDVGRTFGTFGMFVAIKLIVNNVIFVFSTLPIISRQSIIHNGFYRLYKRKANFVLGY
ncbi:uncharacterized protein LOC120277502 [Dioscorea cayenensis subsp. rotundata]|uniref:Uncharacterized protein LOC120277502 n=1 Tax=Dioscorea cayennensis subsp. rotundata TaxID=55577 RepID=A0AB40CP30_DIOCR|nr:uncharacterized protein LOC120277502 [Dioscorea cayenensis subsp. rotundata]